MSINFSDAEKLNKGQLLLARAWLISKCVTDSAVDFIRECNDWEIELLIEKQYENGIAGFINEYEE